MGNKAPKTHEARKGSKRSPKKREKDPVKLVLQRGLHAVLKKGEDGQEIAELQPKGVVLAPVQTMILASFIQTQKQTIDLLLAEDKDDGEEVETDEDTA